MFKVTISGDYRLSGSGEIVDFDNVVGIMPECDERMVNSHVQARYLPEWINADPRYKGKRFNSRRTTYIDSVEVVDGFPCCNGKDIRKMDWNDLQSLAVSKNILSIHARNTVDLQTARKVAYSAYALLVDKIPVDSDGKPMNIKSEECDLNKLPALIVAGEVNPQKQNKLTNEEMLAESEEVDSEFSFMELKKLAKDRKIAFSNTTTKRELNALLFPKG